MVMWFCVAAVDNLTWSCGSVLLLLIVEHGHVICVVVVDNVTWSCGLCCCC